jgi:hypothetical protein
LSIFWLVDPGWFEFSVTLPAMAPTTGRFGLRYVVSDTSANGDYLGIDDVSVKPVPEPATLSLVGLGVVALGLRRRRR